MPERQAGGVKLERSPIDAGHDVTVVGGDKIEVAGQKYEITVVPPPSDASVEQLSRALERNRTTLAEDEKELEDLVAQGRALDDPDAVAAIRNALAAMRNIELLVPAIKLRGGLASFKAGDGRPDVRLNAAIARGRTRWQRAEEDRERKRKQEEFITAAIAVGALLLIGLVIVVVGKVRALLGL